MPKELIKFFRVNNGVTFLEKQPFKLLHSWFERIIGREWFYKQTNVLQKDASFNERSVLLKMFPVFDIKHEVLMPEKNPFLEPGGKIVVANHEGFCLDGLFLAWFINQYRTDFKFVAISYLNFPFLEDFCFFLDLGVTRKKDINKNAVLYKKIICWLKEGRMVIIFPEQLFAKKQKWLWEKRMPWSDLPYFLSKSANVPVIPIRLCVPLPCFMRYLFSVQLFFYNIKMPHIASFCRLVCALFCVWQIKFSAEKNISCIIGQELTPGSNETRGNCLRDHVYSL